MESMFFSEAIKGALESAVVGQVRAVNSVVRGVTRVVSGITPRERPFAAYLLVGPLGTGKTHLVRSLGSILHGDDTRIVVADCGWLSPGDPWTPFVTQIAPLFVSPPGDGRSPRETPPLSIILVEDIDRAPNDFRKTMARVLESGQVLLPEGSRGVLKNCFVFLTTSECSQEILDDTDRIGFTGSFDGDEEVDDDEHDVVRSQCRDELVKHFGSDLVSQVDGTILLHHLASEHLAGVLDQRSVRLNRWLAPRGFRCELRPEAREFLLGKGSRHPRHGARDLVRAHRQHVEFPVADLLVSGGIPWGGRVEVSREKGIEHLHFTVVPSETVIEGTGDGDLRRIPISWESR